MHFRFQLQKQSLFYDKQRSNLLNTLPVYNFHDNKFLSLGQQLVRLYCEQFLIEIFKKGRKEM